MKRVLVTGASGFIGTRLAEHLRLGRGIPVRGLIHRPERAVRLARLDVELVRGDLRDADSVRRAVEGCDAVVHLAYGTEGSGAERRALTGGGTATVAEAALRAGVGRFVHLSSVAVWGFAPEQRVLDESVAPRASGHPYVDGKLEAERAVAAASARGLPAVVLRPTNVFGPWSSAFTVAPMLALRAGAIALVGDGAGPANAAYVDNVVHAILLALEDDRAVGQTFVVSDDLQLTWREWYEAYAQLGGWTVRSVTPDEYRALRRPGKLLRAAAGSPRLRSVARRGIALVPGGSERLRRRMGSEEQAPAPPSEELALLQTSAVRFRIDRARELLGYEPPVPFDVAMRLTADWLRFARLL